MTARPTQAEATLVENVRYGHGLGWSFTSLNVRCGYELGWSFTPLNGKCPTLKGWQEHPRETLVDGGHVRGGLSGGK